MYFADYVKARRSIGGVSKEFAEESPCGGREEMRGNCMVPLRSCVHLAKLREHPMLETCEPKHRGV